MIIEITRGDDPMGLVAYLVGTSGNLRDGAHVVALEGVASIESAPAEMRAVYRQSERCKSPILHISIALDHGEMLEPSAWRKVWNEVAAHLQMPGHQRIVVAHNERDHQHQHGGFNIINPETGRTPPKRLWSPAQRRFLEASEQGEDISAVMRSWDTNLKFRLQALARRLEEMLGLANANAPEKWASRNRGDGVPTPGAKIREERTGIEPLITRMPEMKKALRQSSWSERAAALSEIGVGLRHYAGKNKSRTGLVLFALDDPENAIAGSALGSDYGLRALERTAEQTLADFLVDQSASKAGSPPQQRGRDDPLWNAFRQDRETAELARIEWQRQFDVLLAAQREDRAAKVKLQSMEKRRLLRTCAPHNRLHTSDQIAVLHARERENWRSEYAAERKQARGYRPTAPDWRTWLEQQTISGNEAAARRLAHLKRSNGVSRPVSSTKAARHGTDRAASARDADFTI